MIFKYKRIALKYGIYKKYIRNKKYEKYLNFLSY